MRDHAEHLVEIQRLHAPLVEALEGKRWSEAYDLASQVQLHAATLCTITLQRRQREATEQRTIKGDT